MFSIYNYNSGITAAQLLQDIVALCTGTSDPNSLSAACNKASTVIFTDYDVAGWSVHDAAAGTNAVCLKAPCLGAPAKFKYVVIDTNTAGIIYTKLYESWNETTHVGTNIAYSCDSSSNSQRWASTGGGLLLSVSARRLLLEGVASGLIGTNTGSGATGVVEVDTQFDWCGPATAFTPVCFIYNSGPGYYYEHCYFPRSIGKDGGVKTSSNAWTTMTTFLANVSPSYGVIFGDSTYGSGAPMASGSSHPVFPLIGWNGGTASSTCFSGIYGADVFTVAKPLTRMDELVISGKTYITLDWHTSLLGRMIVPRG